MAEKEAVRTEEAPAPFQGAPYSQAIKAGGLVFVSGQVALVPGRDRSRSAPMDRGADRAGVREPAGDPRGRRQQSRPGREDDRLPDEPRRLPGDERRLPQHVGEVPPARATRRGVGASRRARWSRSTRLRSPDSIADGAAVAARPAAAAQGVYLVGGAVRDLLLGRRSFDVDLAVEGDAIEFARGLGGEVTAHGRFGTAVVRFPDGRQLDVVTARRETYAGARGASRRRGRHDRRRPRPARLHGQRDGGVARERLRPAGRPARRPRRPRERGRSASCTSDRSSTTRLGSSGRSATRTGSASGWTRRRSGSRGRELPASALLSGARMREEIVALLSEDEASSTRSTGSPSSRPPDRLEPGLVERLDALRAELDPDAPRWRLRLTALAAAHPRADRAARAPARRMPGRSRRRSRWRRGWRRRPTRSRSPDLAGRAPEGALLALARHDSPALRDWFTRLRSVRLEVTGADLAELGVPESPRVGEILEELRRRKLRGELGGRRGRAGRRERADRR